MLDTGEELLNELRLTRQTIERANRDIADHRRLISTQLRGGYDASSTKHALEELKAFRNQSIEARERLRREMLVRALTAVTRLNSSSTQTNTAGPAQGD